MRWRTIVTAVFAVGLLALTGVSPALAGDIPDVDIRLIPVAVPHGSDTLLSGNAYLGSAGVRNEFSFDWTVDPNYLLEVWISDVGSVNTGVTSAYVDVSWDIGAINDATVLTHTGLFNFFPEGTINNPLSEVTNFGGSDATFTGQGLETTFARVGWIDFLASGNGVVNLDAVIGLGEIGVLNRTVGEVQITGATVNTPEPTSLLLLGLGALVCCRRR